jgi:hypothetical protein
MFRDCFPFFGESLSLSFILLSVFAHQFLLGL